MNNDHCRVAVRGLSYKGEPRRFDSRQVYVEKELFFHAFSLGFWERHQSVHERVRYVVLLNFLLMLISDILRQHI